MLLDWFAQNARDLPWRRTHEPYAIWVSEIMLQQTQVKTVIPYWERWMRELPTLTALAEASSERIHKLWEGLGYYTRVRNMQKAAQHIVANHSSDFPTNFEHVLALSGIGRYTAGAICSIAFNQPTPILDGNVIRVLTRIFAIDGNVRDKATNTQLWELSQELVSHARNATRKNVAPFMRESMTCSHLNQSLMELGALVCTPRAPQCLLCPLSKSCVAFAQGRIGELPNLGTRTKITERQFAAFIWEQNGKYLVRQRPEGVVNAHLWEFPNVELESKTDLRSAAQSLIGVAPETFSQLCTIKHSITRCRITLNAYKGQVKPSSTTPGIWKTLPQLQKLAFTSAHKRILNLLRPKK